MNLLVLSTWFPYPPDNGSRLRAYHLLRDLAGAGHRVRLVAGLQPDRTADDLAASPLAGWCTEVVALPWRWHNGSAGGALAAAQGLFSPIPRAITETFNPAIRDAVLQQLAKPTDAVFVLELGMDAYVPPECAVPLILEQAELSSLFQHGNARQLLSRHKAQEYWRGRLGKYVAITAASDEEAAAVRRVAPFRASRYIATVPNGVDVSAHTPGDRKPVPGRLLYNGSLSYEPNLDAVQWLVREILPRIAERAPEAHLVVTGRYDPDSPEVTAIRSDSRVHLTGFLPDLRSTLAEAAVCAVPLRRGGGTRLKVLEAWAAGVPVVATPVGAAGLAGENGTHLTIAPGSADAFADAVVRLLEDPSAGWEMARRARRLVEERYDWPVIGAHWDAVLDWATNPAPEVTVAGRLDGPPPAEAVQR